MAYKRRLSQKCEHNYCRAPARWEVFNRAGRAQGDFCTKHAEEKLDELHKTELSQEGQDDGA